MSFFYPSLTVVLNDKNCTVDPGYSEPLGPLTAVNYIRDSL